MERTTRSHYKVFNGELVPKKSYDSELEALTAARYYNSKDYSIHKMVAYRCIKCDKWHIGSNGRLLTDEDREKARLKLNLVH